MHLAPLIAGSTVPLQRGASMTTSEHIDPAVAAAQVAAMEEDPDTADIPEGAVKFELEAHEIQAALMEDSIEASPATSNIAGLPS